MADMPVVQNGNGKPVNTVVNHISSSNALTVGELKNILRNFSDTCPITSVSCKYIFPKDGEGQLQIISQS